MHPILAIIYQAILSFSPKSKFYIKTVDPYNHPSECLIWQGTMVKGEKTEEIEDEEGNISTNVIEYEYLVPSEKPSWDEIESALGENAAAVNEFFLSFIKERKLIELKRWRDFSETQPITISINDEAVTLKREKISTIGDKIFFLQKSSDLTEVSWVADSGKRLSLTLSDLQSSYEEAKLAIVLRDETLYQEYFSLRDKINASTDYNELSEIKF